MIATLVICMSGAVLARPYTLCAGKEFNTRIKNFVNQGYSSANGLYNISQFTRGYNPPDDSAYYVDISEDSDKSVIAYMVASEPNILYWYSDDEVNLNEDCSYMFSNFYKLRSVDLSKFLQINSLKDTRYMFSNCVQLRKVTFKTDAQKAKSKKYYEVSEMQGMFFNCESLREIDLTWFNTLNVDNMTELFYKCYNLRNIYVNKSLWRTENVLKFDRMFSQCHCLRTNTGIRATDIAEDDYEKYAVAGEDGTVGFLKDSATEYSDYGENIADVPTEGVGYITEEPATTVNYSEEPENDGTGANSGDGSGSLLGDKSTGYYAEKEQQSASGVITPNYGQDPLTGQETSAIPESSVNTQSETAKTVESSINIVESTVKENETIVETTKENRNEIESINIESTVNESSVDESGAAESSSGKRVMELDEYLKQQGLDGESQGSGQDGEKQFNYDFLIFAIIILSIAILLLVGMVLYLFKDNKNNDSNKSI